MTNGRFLRKSPLVHDWLRGERKQWTLCLFDPGPRLMFSSVMLHNYSLETFQVARVGNFASLATCGLGVEFERVQVWPETTMLWKYCTAVMMICYNTALTDTQGSRQWNYCRNAVTYICTTGLLSVELTRPGPDLTLLSVITGAEPLFWGVCHPRTLFWAKAPILSAAWSLKCLSTPRRIL